MGWQGEERDALLCRGSCCLIYFWSNFLVPKKLWAGKRLSPSCRVDLASREDIDAVTLLSSIDFAAQVQISGRRHIDDEGRGQKWPKLILEIKLLPKYSKIQSYN